MPAVADAPEPAGSHAARAGGTIAILFVLAVYLFFGTRGRFGFSFPLWHQELYASLSEAFLRGQTHLLQEPSPELKALADPWDPAGRAGVDYIWDASYFGGRYYLYFSPLPALLFQIPHRLVRGVYPSHQMAGIFFSSVAFLFATAFLHRALVHGGRRTALPFPLWVLFAGLGLLVPWTLVAARMYEVAILCAMAASAAWAWSLLRFFERPSWRWGLALGASLSLAIAGRPTLILLAPVTAFAVLSAGERRTRPILAALLLPVVLVGGSYAIYNFVRFGNPLEVGLKWQLTGASMVDNRPCGARSCAEVARLVNQFHQYCFQGPFFHGSFPWVKLRPPDLDPSVSFVGGPEEVGGIAAVAPILLFGAMAAAVLWSVRAKRDPGDLASFHLLAAGAAVMVALSSCHWMTTRYQLDFVPLLALGAIVAIERALEALRVSGVRTGLLRAACALLVCYSVILGVLLGFTGKDGEFRKRNPRMFQRVERLLTP